MAHLIRERWFRFTHRLLEPQRLLGWRFPAVAASWLVRPDYLVYARDLSAPLPALRGSLLTSWTTLRETDVPTIEAIDPAMTRAEVTRRLGDGQVCNLGWHGADLAYYYWDTTDPTLLTYLGRRVRPLPGQIVPCGAFTAEPFRNRGVHTAATIESCHRKRARGADTAIFFVAWWHTPAIRVLTRDVGATLIGSIGFWNLGIRRAYFVSGAVRLDSPTSFCIDR